MVHIKHQDFPGEWYLSGGYEGIGLRDIGCVKMLWEALQLKYRYMS